MSNIFNASEIYEFAKQIEVNGEKFYNMMAIKFDNPEIKELFEFLAKEEVNHKKIFTNMLSKLENYNLHESYGGEYLNYLHAYADNLLFNFDKFDDDISKVEDIESALQFAIGKELDTIMYFQEMKNVVLTHQKNLLDDIISEERKHVILLSEKKRTLKK
jgi:rubrerythrin